MDNWRLLGITQRLLNGWMMSGSRMENRRGDRKGGTGWW